MLSSASKHMMHLLGNCQPRIFKLCIVKIEYRSISQANDGSSIQSLFSNFYWSIRLKLSIANERDEIYAIISKLDVENLK
jgi:hypothetical protein